MSASLVSRVHRPHLLERVCTAKEAAYKFFKNGQSLGWSGFTPAGYPKVVPIALADRVEETGEKLRFQLFIGASVGAETEDRWAQLDMISRYVSPPSCRFCTLLTILILPISLVVSLIRDRKSVV